MPRKIIAVLLSVLAIVVIMGCSKKETSKTAAPAAAAQAPAAAPGPGPTATDLKDTADKVLKMTESQEWEALYDYISSDIQKTISKDQFIALKKDEAAHSKIVYKNFKMGEPKMLAQWNDVIDGKTYNNVAQVPYTVDVETPKGEMNVNNTICLIQDQNKNWRYLWIRKR